MTEQQRTLDRVTKALLTEFQPEDHRMVVILDDDPESVAYILFGDDDKVRRPEDSDIDVMRACFRVNHTIYSGLSKRWRRKAKRILQREWQAMGASDD